MWYSVSRKTIRALGAGMTPTDAKMLHHIIYDVVQADVETEAEAENDYQSGYAEGFNDARARIMNALTAAAEVGGQTMSYDPDWGGTIEYNKKLREIDEAVAAATIERCAQIADKFSDDDSIQDSKDVAGAIAAAIRALKDAPA